ncbi:AsnC family transcriptional regulator [Thermococci archaeon]|nr:MAG: AsnC family transcriptional regulator [Thermococci archaeon]
MDEEHLLTSRQLTSKQFELLEKFYEEGKTIEVRTVKKTQDEIASELRITRQTLNNHLKVLKELGFIRTGRGFIDLTEKALKFLGEKGEVFVLVKIEPVKRREVYESIKKLKVKRACRVTGDVDLILEVDKARLDEVLGEVASLDGVRGTRTHIVLEAL